MSTDSSQTLDTATSMEAPVDKVVVVVCDPDPGNMEQPKSAKAEIDTSAPFESVKQAANRFGGIGFWKPHSHKLYQASQENGEVYAAKIEEQAAQLEKELILKERETLEVLKELEFTKTIVEQLKVKLQKESLEVKILHSNLDENSTKPDSTGGLNLLCPTSTPGFILMELKQAKLNLTRTTNDLADIRSTVESYNRKIEKERISLEKTRKRLSSGSLKISSLEEEINQAKQKLNMTKDTESISVELQRLNSEREEFVKIGEAAKTEVVKAMAEIEETKSRIKTAEIRLIAAKKMKEAARATEAVALADMKALSRADTSSSSVTLSIEEYTSLKSKAGKAEEECKKRVMEAVAEVDDANLSREDVLKKVEEATEEVKSSKRVLQEALNRVESANRGKLEVEESLRKWRSEHGQKRRSVQNSTKFKNSTCPSYYRKDMRLVDLNGVDLAKDEVAPLLKPTLSIGQILSRKLYLVEEMENEKRTSSAKRKVSLGQMLSKSNSNADVMRNNVMKNRGASSGDDNKENNQKQIPVKRKKFVFGRISILVSKQNKKKKQNASSRRTCV